MPGSFVECYTLQMLMIILYVLVHRCLQGPALDHDYSHTPLNGKAKTLGRTGYFSSSQRPYKLRSPLISMSSPANFLILVRMACLHECPQVTCSPYRGSFSLRCRTMSMSIILIPLHPLGCLFTLLFSRK